MPNYTSKTTGDEVARDCKSQIANKTILVTGATPGGLGATFATTIAPYGPAVIILASHSVVKAGDTAKAIEAVAPDVKTVVIELDLASISQVRKAAENILGCVDTIDVIVNNAGIMAAPYSKTVDGIESQFGTNHVGVIIETSLSRHVAMEDFAELGVLDRKLGNREFWDQPFMLKSPAEGVATHVFAAFHPALEEPEHNGAYLEDSQVVDVKQIQSWARDTVEAQMLWRLSEEMVSETFSY
ncbi:hypothetical protein SPBR_01874 [Sporothrix brasiliensis 5110]|uniref:Short-chain dehydrogenase n=1 Tax=Sporothrix brasiliensis 5110 TaxID=1398154 RepID=A0A0C2ISH1_9PEZI|nr:uncharacterized protein SPBR_01874 [Sporothrix brasiliensis 5110]KIH91986.1 hypothetical protein SPBR_01874 [Sporothrix brasiliensis 5110]